MYESLFASNENLQEAYRKEIQGRSYHRFNEFSISPATLRSRKDDIPLFADFFLKKTTEELNKEVAGFEDDVMHTFLQYSWPAISGSSEM
jgi:two-component system response regulator HydG